jgi:succinate-acetate transporter protein
VRHTALQNRAHGCSRPRGPGYSSGMTSAHGQGRGPGERGTGGPDGTEPGKDERGKEAPGNGYWSKEQPGHPTVFLRPLASPVALGFGGLAVATLMLSAYQLGWVPPSEVHQVGWMLVLFAAPVQFIASVLGFLDRDTVVGTGMGLQGAAWLLVGAVMLHSAPGQRSAALGIFFFVAAAVLAPSVLSASMSKGVVAAVMATTSLRWVLTGVFERLGSHPWKWVAGWTGVALCVIAVYGAVAMELEDQRRKTVLPTLRWGKGREAITGDFAAQVARVRQEAGVREQL